MFFKNPLDKKFTQWARGKKVLPPNASMMKEKFLSSARLPSGAVKQVRPPKFYFKILSVGLAVMVLYVGVNYYRNSMITSKSSYVYDNGFGGGGAGGLSLQSSGGSGGEDMALQYGAATGLGYSESGFVRSVREMAATVQDAIYDGIYTDRAYAPAMQNSTVRDTREFSKISYNSTLKTRDVEDISTRILTTVRGNGGRVDDASIQEKYSYINFVIPKDNLLQFKTEIKSMVGKKFYKESLHIQNLLPEKVGIEDSAKTHSRLLSDAQDKLKDLNVKHTKTIADLQRSLNNINGILAKFRAEVTTDTIRQKQIKTEISSLVARQGAVQKQITDENTWYGWDSTRLEQDVKNNQTQLDNLGEQEKNLLDNVETVQGYVSVQWMSLWQMINIYIPYLWAWVVGAIVLLLIFNYFSKRRTITAW